MLKLYLISQDVNDGYDTFDSAIVAAISAHQATFIHPGDYRKLWPDWGNDNYPTWAKKPEQVTVKYIGKAKVNTKSGVICASFNAG